MGPTWGQNSLRRPPAPPEAPKRPPEIDFGPILEPCWVDVEPKLGRLGCHVGHLLKEWVFGILGFSSWVLGFSSAVLGFSSAVLRFSSAVLGFSFAVLGFSSAVLGFSSAVFGFSSAVLGFSSAVLGFSSAVLALGFSSWVLSFSAGLFGLARRSEASSYRDVEASKRRNVAREGGRFSAPLRTSSIYIFFLF